MAINHLVLSACLLASPLWAGTPGDVLQYEATIASVKKWIDYNGERQCIFALSDTTHWITLEEAHYDQVALDGWQVGDLLILIPSEQHWMANNPSRSSMIPLYPLCHKTSQN